eukprot:TRINITY_DN8446_c0_g1_i1.p1 TRINITY_DN8446_c0_g1~~TRINITY_DN8446_c0_g1_i1.p1  ORF type:complete len:165 (-),score=24.83 TRINITY_DN8446_c0_g1_i1:1-495(-)
MKVYFLLFFIATLYVGFSLGNLSYNVDNTYYMGLIAGKVATNSVANFYNDSIGTNANFVFPNTKFSYCSHPSLQFGMWADVSGNVLRTIDMTSTVKSWLGKEGESPQNYTTDLIEKDEDGNLKIYGLASVSDCFYSSRWFFFAFANNYPYLITLDENGSVSSVQ